MIKILKKIKNLFSKKARIMKTAKFSLYDTVLSAYKYEWEEYGEGRIVDMGVKNGEVKYHILFENGAHALYEECDIISACHYEDFEEKINERIK